MVYQIIAQLFLKIHDIVLSITISALFILEARLVGSLWTKLEQDGHVNIKMDIA